MTDGKEDPGVSAPGHDRQTETELSEIISQKNTLLPVVFLPRHVFGKLLKIAAFRGIPAQILAQSEITKFVIRHWNRAEKRPKRSVE